MYCNIKEGGLFFRYGEMLLSVTLFFVWFKDNAKDLLRGFADLVAKIVVIGCFSAIF